MTLDSRPAPQQQQQQQQQPLQYSLPGVMHYLKQEFTRNESDRISWNSEREEMKAAIAKLTAENTSLKKINQSLENELKTVPKKNANVWIGNKSIGNEAEKLASEVANLNIEPLKQARQHLKNRMSEVVYLLKGDDPDMVDILELKKTRGMLALAERKKKREVALEVEQYIESSQKTQQLSMGIPATPEPDSPDAFFKKNPTPDLTQEPPTPITEESTADDIDTDTETVMGDDDAPTGSSSSSGQTPESSELPSPPVFISKPLFSLASHPSTIISLSIFEGQLLTASKEGDIMSWSLPTMMIDPTKTKPEQSYFDTGTPTFLKWINKDSFVSASKNQVRIWETKQTEAPKTHFKTKSEIKDIQIVDKFMVVLDNDGLHIHDLLSGKYNSKAPNTIPNSSEYQAFVLTSSKIYALSTHGIDEIDPVKKANLKSYALKDVTFDTPVTSMTIWSQTLAISSADKCVLYDLTTRSTWPIGPISKKVVKCEVNEKHYTIFYANGDVDVFSRSTDKVVTRLNHYGESKMDDSLSAVISPSVGSLYQDKYVITGGEDQQVRGWEIN